MTTQRNQKKVRSLALFALLATLVVAPAAVAASPAVTDENVAELTVKAKTAADHQALAEYYKAKVIEAEQQVARHEQMMNSVRGTAGKPYRGMRGHCRRLIASYSDAAAEYGDLANLHAEIAEELAK